MDAVGDVGLLAGSLSWCGSVRSRRSRSAVWCRCEWLTLAPLTPLSAFIFSCVDLQYAFIWWLIKKLETNGRRYLTTSLQPLWQGWVVYFFLESSQMKTAVGRLYFERDSSIALHVTALPCPCTMPLLPPETGCWDLVCCELSSSLQILFNFVTLSVLDQILYSIVSF